MFSVLCSSKICSVFTEGKKEKKFLFVKAATHTVLHNVVLRHGRTTLPDRSYLIPCVKEFVLQFSVTLDTERNCISPRASDESYHCIVKMKRKTLEK
ncbi:hypothetical protein CEXT_702681 [Caerostris extrusa]|uniref:Uncharacterized protein n=1 Tax=Caerostris extrusa TaxID=172846 RepID=A0AAV4YAC6_CAEEX|nr:hypothetical protein CEXT_702681 [Caerostris extrusa]